MRWSLRFCLWTVYVVSFALTAPAQQIAAAAYTPKFSACPARTSLLRLANSHSPSLSALESAYLRDKRAHVLPRAWSSYLQSVQRVASQQHVELPPYVYAVLSCVADSPQLAIATSGGGHRAAIFGAGVLTAIDGRNATSVKLGTGGLLQASSYLAGLSGGSWLVSSFVQANFPTFPELIFGSPAAGTEGWLASVDLIQPSADPAVITAFFGSLVAEISGKFLSGFPVTIADLWARLLSRHFVNGTTTANFFDPNITHGAGQTFSGLVNIPSFVSHDLPFPIVTSDSITDLNDGTPVFFNQSEDGIPLTNPIYEFTPFEMGSYDPMLSAFTPTKFLGSRNSTVCATGFDQLAFIEGASSELFNELNTSATALAASPIGPLFGALQATFNQTNIELDATYVPNPFRGLGKGRFPDSDSEFLRLVDGGEDGQVLPLQPLLVKARNVDTIVAIDAPADTLDNFAAGFSLTSAQERASLFPDAYSFPPVPKSVDEFAALNLTKRPTFFGCNSAPSVPLLIYIANGGPPLNEPPVTNTPTAQAAYPPAQIQAMLDQTFDVATQGIPVKERNGGLAKDPLWPICLACAVVDKQRSRSRTRRSGVCESCLKRYCWS